MTTEFPHDTYETDSTPLCTGMPPAASARPYRTRNEWTPARKRTFLEALARCGNVRSSALYCGMSHEAAYQLRRREAAFATAWDGALLIARDIAQDTLADKALNGITEEIVYHGEITATRTRFDGRLLLALLGRLDKHEEKSAGARRGAARFDELLDRIGEDKDASDLTDTPLPEEEPWKAPARGAEDGPGDMPEDRDAALDPDSRFQGMSEAEQLAALERYRELARMDPEDVPVDDLDWEECDDWDEDQWERAFRSGMIGRLTEEEEARYLGEDFGEDVAGEEVEPEDAEAEESGARGLRCFDELSTQAEQGFGVAAEETEAGAGAEAEAQAQAEEGSGETGGAGEN